MKKVKTQKIENSSDDKFYGLLPATNLLACEAEVRALEKGEMLLVIQDLSKIVTPSFAFGTDGTVSATSREGQASVLLIVRGNDQVVVLPFAMFVAFGRNGSCDWTWEIPVGLGGIEEKQLQLSAEWITAIPWQEPHLRVLIEPQVIEKLDTSDIIAPDGESFGPGVPMKKYLEDTVARIPNALEATRNCISRSGNRPRVRR